MATPKVTALPAQYAKFITALAGVAIAYLTAYGTTWNLQGFLVAAGAALAVFGVPNASAPLADELFAPPSAGLIVPGQSGKAALPPTGTVTVVSGSGGYTPAAGPPEPPAPPAGASA